MATKKNNSITVKSINATLDFEDLGGINYGLNSVKLVDFQQYKQGNAKRDYPHAVLVFITAEAGEDFKVKKVVRIYDTKPTQWKNPETGYTEYFDSPCKQFLDSVHKATGGITNPRSRNDTLKHLAENWTPCMITRELLADRFGHPILNGKGSEVWYDKVDFNIPQTEEVYGNRLNEEEM